MEAVSKAFQGSLLQKHSYFWLKYCILVRNYEFYELVRVALFQFYFGYRAIRIRIDFPGSGSGYRSYRIRIHNTAFVAKNFRDSLFPYICPYFAGSEPAFRF
jgi:hypothetical protein